MSYSFLSSCAPSLTGLMPKLSAPPLREATVFDQPIGTENLSFIKRLGRFIPQTPEPERLRNNLRKAVGLLEVANLGDVAANVWNTVPIPEYIVFLMVIGGLIAFSMLYFVVTDAILSWRNVQALLAERSRLKAERQYHSGPELKSIDSFLLVNLRELGSEAVDRLGMALLLGLGAFVVGIGTFMAPAGENRRIFEASNYLTGYIGNAPCAIYGLLNVGWAFFVCSRASSHQRVIAQGVEDENILTLLKKRTTKIYRHAVLNGITVLVAGAAAMLTATQRLAYAVLTPCCIASFSLNWYWRIQIGYGRPLQVEGIDVSKGTLVHAIEVNTKHHQALGSPDLDFPSVMEYIVKHHAFKDFCLEILHDRRLKEILTLEVHENPSITIEHQKLVFQVANVNDDDAEHIRNAARKVALEICEHRERWLLETLGSHMTILYQESKRDWGDSRLEEGNFTSPSREAGRPEFQGDSYEMQKIKAYTESVSKIDILSKEVGM